MKDHTTLEVTFPKDAWNEVMSLCVEFNCVELTSPDLRKVILEVPNERLHEVLQRIKSHSDWALRDLSRPIRNKFESLYSEAELKLIEVLSPHWRSIVSKVDVNPPNLYMILANEVFISGRGGREVEALRAACSAITACKPYRGTPEFDALCSF